MKATDIAKAIIFLMDIYGLAEPNSTIAEVGKGKIPKLMYIAMGIALKIGIVPKTAVMDTYENIALECYFLPQDKVIVSLFNEIPEAWPLGPMFKKIYRNYEQLHIEALSANYKPFYEVKEGEYVKQDKELKLYTNSIENVWGTLKRGIIGIYHHVSKKHLQG